MVQVTYNCDPKLLIEVDREALERGISRSRFIVDCINAYFAPQPPSSVEVNLINKDLTHLREILTMREAEIADIREQNGRLWLQFKECNDRLVQYQLPPPEPKRGFWSKLFRREKKE